MGKPADPIIGANSASPLSLERQARLALMDLLEEMETTRLSYIDYKVMNRWTKTMREVLAKAGVMDA